MSIKVENNLLTADKKEAFEQRVHFIPCRIDDNGAANVSKYFESYVEEKDGELKGTFRGRPLDGVKMPLPDGYKAVIVDENRRPLSEDADRKFQVTGGFNEIIYWNWDKKPSKNDSLNKAMDWIDIAEACLSIGLSQLIFQELDHILVPSFSFRYNYMDHHTELTVEEASWKCNVSFGPTQKLVYMAWFG
ncbi:Ribonuclease H2 subunit C [Eumeta japonica]|uniref:Ribonuclease H2 subunit C n=1 Tax=Eumeta variegata TaxID=151549 RepID=A0A4C1TAY3_EUMVA|nr:Ribonuclease H2 subunit C [Eumeta japonica]